MKKLNGKYKPPPSLSVIEAARAGEADAMEQILQHYDAYINKLCLRTVIKLHARSSHHEGRKPAGVVDWRRTVQGRFFYAAMSALIKLVSCSPVEPQIVQPGSGKRTHSKVKP